MKEAWEDEEDSRVRMHEEAARNRRHKEMAKEILQRNNVVRELQKELKSWVEKQKKSHILDEGTEIMAFQETNKVFRSSFHRFMWWVTSSAAFDNLIMITIFINAVAVALESGFSVKETGDFFAGMDLVFLTIYTLEFVFKVYVEPVKYWGNNYNRFDFVILAVSYPEFVQLLAREKFFNNISYVRVLRALRALRALRSISFVRALRVLVNALLKTLGSIFNLLAVLLLLMYVFAIMGFYLFGPQPGEADTDTNGAENWGSLDQAMYSLWVYVTADGWVAFQTELDDRGFQSARIFTVFFLFVGNFIFTNLFIGVIINNLDEAQEEERVYQMVKKNALVRAKKDILSERQSSDFKAADVRINPKEVDEALKQIGQKLRHDDIVPMNHLTCNLVWFKTYVYTLRFVQLSMYRTQQLNFGLARIIADLYEFTGQGLEDTLPDVSAKGLPTVEEMRQEHLRLYDPHVRKASRHLDVQFRSMGGNTPLTVSPLVGASPRSGKKRNVFSFGMSVVDEASGPQRANDSVGAGMPGQQRSGLSQRRRNHELTINTSNGGPKSPVVLHPSDASGNNNLRVPRGPGVYVTPPSVVGSTGEDNGLTASSVFHGFVGDEGGDEAQASTYFDQLPVTPSSGNMPSTPGSVINSPHSGMAFDGRVSPSESSADDTDDYGLFA